MTACIAGTHADFNPRAYVRHDYREAPVPAAGLISIHVPT